uniref:Phosphoprotein n=1 Tax=Hapavirus flanders TaxID=1972612 RepID=A0A385I4M7_9RHAB|nr:phosphoprotein [Hapavirus flanders]
MENIEKRKELGKKVDWANFSASVEASVDDDDEDYSSQNLPSLPDSSASVDDWACSILNPKEVPPITQESPDQSTIKIGDIRIPNHLTFDEENNLLLDIESLLLQLDQTLSIVENSPQRSKRVISIYKNVGSNTKPPKNTPPPIPQESHVPESKSSDNIFNKYMEEVLSDLEKGLMVKKIAGGVVKLTLKTLGVDPMSFVGKSFPDKRAAYRAILKKSPKRQMISSTCISPY